MVTALVGLNTIRRNPGAKILYNLICSRSVPEAIMKRGRHPGALASRPLAHQEDHARRKHRVRRRAFRAFLLSRQLVRRFGHDRADAVPARSSARRRQTVSEVIAPIDRRLRSGEINSHVRDIPPSCTNSSRAISDAQIDHLDGVTIEYPNWWMNVRPSNTEPLLRLNVEGDTQELMERHRDEALER